MSAEKKSQPELPPGAQLDDRFEIVERIGGGNFSTVYRARQIVFGRKLREVALKLFKAEHVNRDNFSEIFGDAIALIGLQEEDPSPTVAQHLIQVYDIGMLKTPIEQAFMSMKLISGRRTLDSEMRRYKYDPKTKCGGMPVEMALGYLRQALIPLAWMHTLDPPAIHADLKPDNVLLTEGPDRKHRLILADFGLAARLPLSSRGGAIQYQAPETLANAMVTTSEPASESSDVYGVGLMLYEMLTGSHPFSDVGLEAAAGGDERAFIHAHFEARKWQIRPPRDVGPREQDPRIVPASELNKLDLNDHPQVVAMLNQCLSFRKSERYPNARLLLDDIDRYLKTGSMTGLIPPPFPCDTKVSPPTPRLARKTPEMLIADALTLRDQNQLTAALEVIERLLKEHPRHVDALLAKARILAASGKVTEAEGCCNEVWSQTTNDPQHSETRAKVYDTRAELHNSDVFRKKARELREGRANQPRR